MIRTEWYPARMRWAVMVEGSRDPGVGRSGHLFRSEDRDSAFRRALEIGEGEQGGEEEGTRRRAVGRDPIGGGGHTGLPWRGIEGRERRCTGHACRRRRRSLLNTVFNRPRNYRSSCHHCTEGKGGAAAGFLYSPGLRSALNAPQKPRRRAPLQPWL